MWLSAYGGAAPPYQQQNVPRGCGTHSGTEAEHAGALRFACVYWGVSSPAVDGQDVPPTAAHPFDADANSLAISRTTAQVLNIVYHGGNCSGGFYPQGMNGTVKCQRSSILVGVDRVSLPHLLPSVTVVRTRREYAMLEGLFQPMHLLVILFIALMIFGPKKLPGTG